MEYDINAALERLEKNLSEVESAKKQVDKTVASSEKLQHVINEYSDFLSSLNKEISKFIDEVRNSQDIKTSKLKSAVDEMTSSCENIATKFHENVKASTDSFNANLSGSLSSLNEDISKTIDEVGKFQEIKMSELKSVTDKIKSSCDNVFIKFKEDIKTSTDIFDTKLADSISEVRAEIVRLKEQVDKMAVVKEALDKATDDVNGVGDKVDVLTNDLKDSQGVQDKTLSNIESILNAFPDAMKLQLDAVISENEMLSKQTNVLDELLQKSKSNGDVASNTFVSLTNLISSVSRQDEMLKVVMDKCDNVQKEIKNCEENISEIVKSLDAYDKVLSSHTNTLAKLYEKVERSEKNSLYVNCAILLGIVISIVLHFLM